MPIPLPSHLAAAGPTASRQDSDPAFEPLQRLVCKQGVGLGGLNLSQRDAVLCLAARVLPQSKIASEAEVNGLLKAFLGGTGSFLRTDHVELRRWLVDTGLWQRDGFGRAYERGLSSMRRSELNALWQQLEPLDVDEWVQTQRARAEHQRLQRRQEWLRAAAAPG